MLCPQCGKDVADGSAYCPECGHCFTPVTPTCPNCHAPIREGQKFCTDCGQALDAAATSTKTQAKYAPPVQPVALFCSHCGGPLREGQAICLQCGFYTPFAGKRQRAVKTQKTDVPFSRGDAIMLTVCAVLLIAMLLWAEAYRVFLLFALITATALITELILVWVGRITQHGNKSLPLVFSIIATVFCLPGLVSYKWYFILFAVLPLMTFTLVLTILNTRGKSLIKSKK